MYGRDFTGWYLYHRRPSMVVSTLVAALLWQRHNGLILRVRFNLKHLDTATLTLNFLNCIPYI